MLRVTLTASEIIAQMECLRVEVTMLWCKDLNQLWEHLCWSIKLQAIKPVVKQLLALKFPEQFALTGATLRTVPCNEIRLHYIHWISVINASYIE
jgi:hypothetical protein